jgi:hypothetical protein
MIKSYADFVANFIGPMLDKIADILEMADKKGLPIDRKTMQDCIESAFIGNVILACIRGVVHIVIACIVCYTAWMISLQ